MRRVPFMLVTWLLAGGCGVLDRLPTVGPPDHLILSGTHDEFNDSWKETVAVSIPINYPHRPAVPLDFWTPTR